MCRFSVNCRLSSVVVAGDQAVYKWYFTIFFDLLGKLYARALSVNVFLKIVDLSFCTYTGVKVYTSNTSNAGHRLY